MSTKPKFVRIFFALLILGFVGFVGLLVLQIAGRWSFQATWALASGWITYPARIFPQITYNSEMIICGLGALCLALFFTHRFLSWLAEKVPALPSPWKFQSTTLLSFLLLSMFGTAIAMTGIIHQAAWLGSTPELTRSTAQSTTRSQMIDAQHLLDRLYLRAQSTSDETRFPTSLIVSGDEESVREDFANHLCVYGKGDSEPWLYPGAGQEFGDASFPVLISPRPNREGRIIVAYSRFHVENHSFDQLPPEIAKFFE